ncbi:MAG: helix-turn-helix domain-containing protein [Pyrinomonadaceae bacterium]|nr:helix-turn-helix domain-containing protein [Pyrinomonadaceae bacterium]
MNRNDYDPSKLVKWREESQKTQEAVAELLNVDRNTISRAENGKVASFNLLSNLCTIYGKSIHELVHEKPVISTV